MTVPTKIVAGDSATWQYTASKHGEADGWDVRALIRGATAVEVQGEDLDDGIWQFKLTMLVCATLQKGPHVVIYVATKDDERQTLDTEHFTVLPDPATSTTPADFRSMAERAIEAIDAVIFKNASAGQAEMAWEGRSFKNMSPGDLMIARSHFVRLLAMEKASAGLSTGNKKIQVRWG